MRDPDRLGKYRIEGILGEGGMGVVYHAVDEDLGRKVAIKTVRPGLLKGRSGRELLERFRREAQAEGRLNHPNIVAIYEFQSGDDGMPFFAMEYVEGKSLKEYLSRGMHFNLDMALHIIVQLLSALSHSHQQGIIHRDIKPANILLLEDDSVKIADFGIARMEESEYTQTGKVMGTPQYFSPEQSLGQKTDARSDLYSAALVMYELLTGEKLFSARSDATSNHRITDGLLAKLDMHPPDSQRILKATLTRALAKEPGKRFQNAEEFSSALRPLLVEKEAPVQPGGKLLIWGGGIVGLILLAVAYFFSQQEVDWQDLFSDIFNAPSEAYSPVALTPEEQKQLGDRLRRGDLHLAVGRLIAPEGSNAAHSYKRAQDIDPDNLAASEGLQAVQEEVLAQLEQLRKQGRLHSACDQLALARRLFPDYREFRLFGDKWQCPR